MRTPPLIRLLEGINQMWARLLGLMDIEPLVPWEDPRADRDLEGSLSMMGSGRVGRLSSPEPLGQLIARARQPGTRFGPSASG